MIELVLKVFLSYLLGSVSGSILIGKLKKVDIRTMGSGSAGGTNAFRTQGPVFALGVVAIDVGKAVMATALIAPLVISGAQTVFSTETILLACGFAAILGHCYPVFHGFNGGKGAATAVGAMIIIEPLLLGPMLITWLLTLALSGYVGVATVLAGLSLVPATLYLGGSFALLVFCAATALFMIFTHRSNLKRLKAGNENRFEKARISNWFGK